MRQAVSIQPAEVNARIWAPSWWAVFGVGVVLWVAALGAVYLTNDILLLPTVILLGSFLVPVTVLVWYLDQDRSPALSPRRILNAFIIAGVVGVLAASLLEYYLVSSGLLGNLEVGPLEELEGAVDRGGRHRHPLLPRAGRHGAGSGGRLRLRGLGEQRLRAGVPLRGPWP